MFAHGESLKEAKLQIVEVVLRYYRGNRTQAARALGVPVRTMRYWISKNRAKFSNVRPQ